jgi:hypothetical protein
MSDTPKKCAHPACQCMAPANEKYCSNSCKDAGSMQEIECKCGHPACAV